MDLQTSLESPPASGIGLRAQRARAIDLHAKASPGYAGKLAATEALLRRAASFAPVVQASSLGAEDVVLCDMVERLGLPIGVFVLDTGALHAETLELLEQLRQRRLALLLAPLQVFHPRAEAVLSFVQREGERAMFKSVDLRKACCAMRKTEPLTRALAGKRAWITGLRREQSGARAEVPVQEQDGAERVKFNPLADWTWGDVWHYIASRELAYNPLHDQFFPSIGCAPCTRAISLGEDSRAGRWWWEQDDQKECGLHVRADHQHLAERPHGQPVAA